MHGITHQFVLHNALYWYKISAGQGPATSILSFAALNRYTDARFGTTREASAWLSLSRATRQ